MKKILLSLSVFITVAGISYGQIPTNGLIAYYPFCGNAHDMSGNGHHLTVTNAALTSDRFGNQNNAFSFNGINSVLYNNNVLSFGSEYTISAWFIAYTVQDGVIVYNGNSNNNGVGLVYDDGAAIPGTKGTMLAGGICFCMAKPASLNQWHHLVLQKETSKFRLYIDDNVVDSTTSSIFSPVGKLHLGMDYSDGTNPFDGKIDEVAIYNRALTRGEITQLYNNISSGCSETSVSESPTNQFIKLYPNPSNGYIKIENRNSEFLKVIVTNTLGQRIQLANNPTNLFIDVPGIYFISFYNANNELLERQKILIN